MASGKQRGGGPGGQRQLKVRLKTAKQRTASSQRWLERQLNDPYVAAAKREGYRSRAAFKLIEIDDKHRLLKSGARVVDLGAAPGGWSQVAAERVRAVEGRGKGQVVAIDLLAVEPIPGVEFLQLDFMDATRAGAPQGAAARGPGRHRALRHGGAGHGPHPHRPPAHHGARRGGGRVCLRGAGRPAGPSCARCCRAAPSASCWTGSSGRLPPSSHIKPPASRAGSAELYVLATGFRGV